jgi:hypothetical protein
VTSLTIAFFAAGAAGEPALGGRLQTALADADMDVSVTTFDALASHLDTAGFDAFFLHGLQGREAADDPLRAADDALRAAFSEAGIAYQVIYGNDQESLRQITQALRATGKAVAAKPTSATLSDPKPHDPDGAAPWAWLCDKCSDSQCEHRLLTDLLKQRQMQLSS